MLRPFLLRQHVPPSYFSKHCYLTSTSRFIHGRGRTDTTLSYSAPKWFQSNGAPLTTGAATYTYDADGNRSTKVEGGVTTQYFYDESDRLIRVESPVGNIVARYEYDPYGARLWKEVGGVRTYFDYTEEGLSSEFDANGTVTKTYLFAPGSEWSTAPLAMKQGGSYHYYQNDHLGTPRKLTNNVGAQTWGATYQAYGAANVAAAGATNNLRFPGQYGDPETGLYHNFQRNYDPGLGGYLEQDPFGVAFTGANRHWYAAGNPGIYTDPTGEIVPLVVVYSGLIWLAGEAYSGFPTVKCTQYLFDRCAYAGYGEYCLDAAVSAATGIGAGAVLKGAWLLSLRSVARYEANVTRVFWSGGEVAKLAAKRWAELPAFGGQAIFLEGTLPGKFLNSITNRYTYPWLKGAWDELSQAYASGAQGKAILFLGKHGGKPRSTWTRIEEPTLKNHGVEVIVRTLK